MKTHFKFEFGLLVISILLLLSACYNNDFQEQIKVEEEEPLSFFSENYPLDSECDSVNLVSSTNPFEEYGFFHNEFMDYLDFESLEYFTDMDSALAHVVQEMYTFALNERANFDFLPNDSATCVTYIENQMSLSSSLLSVSFYNFESIPLNAPSGAPSDFVEYFDLLVQQLDSLSNGDLKIDEVVDNIHSWESDIINDSGLSQNVRNKLLSLGVIARHSLYYWGCLVSQESFLRRPFGAWFRDRWAGVVAFDIVGGIFAGPIGAGISSGGGALLGWLGDF